MTPDEEVKLGNYLDKHLVFYEQARWILDYEKTIKWAVMWWNKD